MHKNFLDFEQPIVELQAKIKELRLLENQNTDININVEINRLEKKSIQLTKSIFEKLTPMQTVMIARHPLRPHTMNYINNIFTDFDELNGDRHFSQGFTILGGLANFQQIPVMVLGHEKGYKTKEKVLRNFGMPLPEDYRKALRLMQLAEKFNLPIITFVDTPGAFPGIYAEERNQSEAIARNLYEMANLSVPIITIVIGEGGSGGALAIAVADRIALLRYSIYATISPEGCASILWKDSNCATQAAEAMGLTATKLKELNLIDNIIAEPLGGAHRDIATTMNNVADFIKSELHILLNLTKEELLQQREQKLLNLKPSMNI